MGRFGRFDPDSFAITGSSVEKCQFAFDSYVLPQCPIEGPSGHRPLEAGKAAAGIGASPGLPGAGDEHPIFRDEPHELALRRLSAAADTAPDGPGHSAGVSSLPSSRSSGIPAGTSPAGAVAG